MLGAAIRAGRQLPGDSAVLNVADAQLLADYRDYQAALTPEQLARFGTFLDDAGQRPARPARGRAILAAPPGQIAVPATDWDAAYSGSRGAADRTAEQIRGELVAASTAAEDRASNLAGINSVILMLGLLIGITIAVLVARGLVRSLRVLRTSALDVAERRLPQTVESVRAGDTPDITVAPVPLTGATRSCRWPARSTRCTGRRSGWPPTRRRCRPASARCSSTCPGAARRWSSASCS